MFKSNKKTPNTNKQKISNFSHQEALANSLVVLGPQKVGKSVFSKNFAKQKNLLYVNIAEALHCDMDLKKLIGMYTQCKTYAFETRNIEARHSLESRFSAYSQIYLSNVNFRRAFPEVKNMLSLGFCYDIYSELSTIDPVCANLYYKKFENQIVLQILNSINCPCVLDMTYTFSQDIEPNKSAIICASEKFMQNPKNYKKLQEHLEKTNQTFEQFLNSDQLSFDFMKKQINKVGTTVALKYPEKQKFVSRFDSSVVMANGNVVELTPRMKIFKEVVYKKSRKNIVKKMEPFIVPNKQSLCEAMDFVDVLMKDNSTLNLENQSIPEFTF